jgi:hypothetical protein
MDIFLPFHKQIFSLFEKHNVKYLLIGGYAVVIYGYNRGTADIDLWVEPTNENKYRIINAFRELNLSDESLKLLSSIDFEGEVKVLNMGEEPNKVDFLTRVQGVSFDEAYTQKKSFPLAEVHVPVVHYDHLVVIKMLAGRPKDLADVDELAKINGK